MLKKWEVKVLPANQKGDAYLGVCCGETIVLAPIRNREEGELICAAVNTLLAAADKANAEPLEYALAVQMGTVDLAGRLTIEIDGGPLAQGIKGGGVLRGRTFRFETTDLETVKRLIDWEKTPPGQQDTFLELMGGDDEREARGTLPGGEGQDGAREDPPQG